jgi:hypothetical protein
MGEIMKLLFVFFGMVIAGIVSGIILQSIGITSSNFLYWIFMVAVQMLAGNILARAMG